MGPESCKNDLYIYISLVYIYVYVRIYDFTCVLFHSGPRDKGQSMVWWLRLIGMDAKAFHGISI